jgi:hypothetical protein
MQLNINLSLDQVLKIINQMSENDRKLLFERMNNQNNINKSNSKESLKEIALKAPTWSEEDYNNYLEVRNYINKSRLS